MPAGKFNDWNYKFTAELRSITPIAGTQRTGDPGWTGLDQSQVFDATLAATQLALRSLAK